MHIMQSCRSTAGNICFKQMKTTTTFRSQQRNKTLKIFHNTNCKIKYAIYFMECTYNMQPTVCR